MATINPEDNINKLDFYCSKCTKTMKGIKFYKYHDGRVCELCKECLSMHINVYEPETFIWILEKLDHPYLPWEWKKEREKKFQANYDKACMGKSKDPRNAAYAMTKNDNAVLGKYLGKMRMKQYKDKFWKDTEALQAEHDRLAKASQNCGDDENRIAELADMKAAYERGEISEAQWMTYSDFTPEQEKKKSLEEIFLESGDVKDNVSLTTFSEDDNSNAYPVNAHPFEEVELDDVGAQLTLEDKQYLALKWGRLYTAADWVWLEQKYDDFTDSFDIQDAARIDTLKQICKLSLKCNQALDSGDTDSYGKLYRAYDTLMKSAKFTEAQKKEDKGSEFSGYGQIVAFAEKEGGFIPRLETKTDRDIADKDLHDMKAWTQELIEQDPTVFKQIEQYIKKREIMMEQEQDEREARARGEAYYTITDEDMAEYNAFVEEGHEADEGGWEE